MVGCAPHSQLHKDEEEECVVVVAGELSLLGEIAELFDLRKVKISGGSGLDGLCGSHDNLLVTVIEGCFSV